MKKRVGVTVVSDVLSKRETDDFIFDTNCLLIKKAEIIKRIGEFTPDLHVNLGTVGARNQRSYTILRAKRLSFPGKSCPLHLCTRTTGHLQTWCMCYPTSWWIKSSNADSSFQLLPKHFNFSKTNPDIMAALREKLQHVICLCSESWTPRNIGPELR